MSTTAIIGIYKATKKHFISHVQANDISGHIGASIGQVATNPLEISKSSGNVNVSDMSNNDLLVDMPRWYTLIYEKKQLIWDERDSCGIKCT